MGLRELPFNTDQLIELYKGFLANIDISQYADVRLSSESMRRKRYELMGINFDHKFDSKE